ncbi:glycosyltransferase [Trichloromonas acetexigens]|uniref:Glycosyltransferase family 1 protein n=1 Tax=Trichloromonas acetexigens TaxID=38815 RepID=A0A550JJK0_9BACT|nr:glycosyltransferase [Desulfuromonas acetexigens]TRO83358.1 glycosyltransferase family 1 protein [Desulfuromonas acetexigens]
MNKEKYNLICFGLMPWSNMWKRTQSVFYHMSSFEIFERSLYVNPEKYPNYSSFYLKKLQPKEYGYVNIVNSEKIFEYTPVHFVPLSSRSEIFKSIESYFYGRLFRDFNGDLPYVLYLNCPNTHLTSLIEQLIQNSTLTIFDYSDDFLEYKLNKSGLAIYRRNIEKFTEKADIITYVNDHVANKYQFPDKKNLVLRNSTNYDNFNRNAYSTIDEIEKIKEKYKYIIGYSGWVNESRVDYDLIDYLSENRRDCAFLFVGPYDKTFVDKFKKVENIFIFEPVSYDVLPNYINYFDVSIVPFLVNEHTNGNDLLKYHDYMSMGKTIVSTNIKTAEEIKNLIYVADSHETFLAYLESILQEKLYKNVDVLKSFAKENSWENRSKLLLYEIESSLKMMR